VHPVTSAVVVAGGRSRRFGAADKAFATVDGRSLLGRVLDALAPAIDELVVNCRPAQRRRIVAHLDGVDAPTAIATDPVPDAGPLAGLATGLETASGRTVVAASCDRPGLESTLVAALCRRATATDADAVVPRLDGHPQPLCAAYDRERVLLAAEAALAADDRCLRALLDRLDVEPVAESTVRERGWTDALRDVDTPADRRRAVARGAVADIAGENGRSDT
jgi:molybdopterin-guanine dinucleotide biosynthesis protein A